MKAPQAIEPEIREFLAALKTNGAADGTVRGYAQSTNCLRSFTDKPFKELTKDDILEWCSNLDNNGISEGTAANRKIQVKVFLRWIHMDKFEGPYPAAVSWLKVRKKNHRLPKQILTQDEVKRLLDSCESQRDRAMLFTLYDTGARCAELLGMRLEDIEFDRYGAVVRVDGKTGERRIRLIQSVPDLRLWISMHPQRNNPQAKVWWSPRGNGISHTRLFGILENAAKKANVNKHVHPHLLRHSNATHLANVLTEAQMRERYGWSKNSDMPSIYTHLSGRDLDSTLLRHYGIKVEAPTEKILAPKSCPWCENVNPPSARFCKGCNSPLDSASVTETIAKEKLKTEYVQRIFKRLLEENPDKMERLLLETKKELEELV